MLPPPCLFGLFRFSDTAAPPPCRRRGRATTWPPLSISGSETPPTSEKGGAQSTDPIDHCRGLVSARRQLRSKPFSSRKRRKRSLAPIRPMSPLPVTSPSSLRKKNTATARDQPTCPRDQRHQRPISRTPFRAVHPPAPVVAPDLADGKVPPDAGDAPSQGTPLGSAPHQRQINAIGGRREAGERLRVHRLPPTLAARHPLVTSPSSLRRKNTATARDQPTRPRDQSHRPSSMPHPAQPVAADLDGTALRPLFLHPKSADTATATPPPAPLSAVDCLQTPLQRFSFSFFLLSFFLVSGAYDPIADQLQAENGSPVFC